MSLEDAHIEATLNGPDVPTPDIQGAYTIHYTQLSAASPNDPLFQEWNAYLRELPRLLDEGYEGQHVLIKGQNILGIFTTTDEAIDAGEERFPEDDFLAQPILEHHPVLWVSWQRVNLA